MNVATFAVKSAFRNRLRTSLTAVGVAVAVVAFLFLRTILASFSGGVDAAAQDRLITRNKISVTQSLPLAYAQRIAAVPGVAALSWANWFGGVYKDPKNFFPKFGIDAETYLPIYPEFLLSPEEKAAFLADRSGCVIGEKLADKFGFKVGDKIPVKGDIYPGDWDFTVRGIFKGKERGTDTGAMFFHWKLLDERMPAARKNQAGVFVFRVGDTNRSAQIGKDVDVQFENSIAETRTESERAFQLAFLSMFGAILTAVQLVSVVMLAILTLILGNTMAMSTRERTSEYAVMRSVGFRPGHIVGLVLAEGFIVAALGFALGAAIAPPLITGFMTWGQKTFGSFVRSSSLSLEAMAFAGLAALVGGILATVIPAIRAGQLNIVDALRRVE